jgi:hypothetical protein
VLCTSWRRQAIFNCFHDFRTLEDVALGRGRRIFDMHKLFPQYTRDPYD